MSEFLLNNKWKIVQLAALLFIVLTAIGFIHGRSVYQERVNQIEVAKKTFGN